MAQKDPIAQERQTAERMFDLLFEAFPGKWAVFKGDGCAGIFDDFREAMAFGYQRYRSQLFLAIELRQDDDEAEDDAEIVGGVGCARG